MAQKSFNVIVDTSSCKEQPTSAPQINQLLAKGQCLPSNTHGMQQGTSPTQMIYHLLWPKGKEYGSPILNGITCRFPIGLVRCNCPLLPLLLAPTLNPAQCTWEASDKQLPNLTQMRGEVWRGMKVDRYLLMSHIFNVAFTFPSTSPNISSGAILRRHMTSREPQPPEPHGRYIMTTALCLVQGSGQPTTHLLVAGIDYLLEGRPTKSSFLYATKFHEAVTSICRMPLIQSICSSVNIKNYHWAREYNSESRV